MKKGAKSPVHSQWMKIISTDGHVRAVAVQATELVRDLVKRHALRGAHAQALGEAAVGGVLLACYCKGGQRINLNIRGTGVCHQALVDAYPDGSVRGYVVGRDEASALKGEGGGPWGSGLMSVLRTRESEHGEGSASESRQPYIGTVPLLTGFLAKDLTFYWVQSEQTPSAVGIAVSVDKKGFVEAAGGFLVQALPGASSDALKQIESHIQEIQSLAMSVGEHQSPMSLLSQIFQDTSFVVMEEKPLQFKCTCSMERVRRALALVGAVELQSMLDEDGSASVKCDFCAVEYRMSGEDLKAMIEAAGG